MPPPGPPADVAAWQADDFREARKTRHPRLAEAIEQLVTRSANSENVSGLLIELLSVDPAVARAGMQPPPPAADPAAQPPGPIPVPSAEIILRTLASSPDEAAHQAVVDVLYGRRLTPLEDRRALELIALAWSATPHAASGDLLFQLLTEPTTFRAAKPEDNHPNLLHPVDARSLQALVWPQIQLGLTADLRLRLTDHLGKKATAKADHDLFGGALIEHRADNLDCWLKMFGNRAFDERVRQTAEGYLASDARWVCFGLLGVPQDVDSGVAIPTLSAPAGALGVATAILGGTSESGPPQSTPQIPEDQMPAYFAQRLWQPELVDRFVKQAGDAPTRLLELTRVLSRIPTDHSRRMLFEVSQRLGPKVVVSAAGDVASLANLVYDPGLLPIIKQIPRDEDPAVHDARLGKTKKPNPRARNVKPAAPTAVDPKLKSKYDWMAFSEALVQAWNRRFKAAIAAKAKTGDIATFDDVTEKDESSGADSTEAAGDHMPPEQAADAKDVKDDVDSDPFGSKLAARTQGARLPIELHDGASVVASYRLVCPDEAAERFPGADVDPLIVHYVCVEGDGRASALLGHYREQLKGAKVRPLADFGRWIDHLGPGSQPGRKRSVDIVITLRDPAAAAALAASAKEKDKDKPKRPESLRIEILCVEINQPETESLAEGKRR